MAIDLQIENVSKSFGDLVLFSDISFTVEERQRIGLIACNGKGNTPLPAHRLASGETLPPLLHRISAATRRAIESAMSLNRNNRPQSVGEFLSLLEGKSRDERAKSKDESDGATVVVSSSTPRGEVSRSDGGDVPGGCVISSESEKSLDNGEKEILCSAQNDKERAASTDAGETVLLTNDKLSPCLRGTSNDVAEGVEERKGLHTDDKKRPDDNTPKRPFNKRLFTIISVAAICIIAVFFGVKSCNDRKAAEAEAQQTTAIAEQERIEAERKAAFVKGSSAAQSGNYSEAVKWYRKAADQGDANAQNSLAGCYYFGKGVAQSYSEAAKWYRKAADQGNAYAQNALTRLGY